MASANKKTQWNLADYHRRRQAWIDRLGGQCTDCGTQDDLQFDHADASTKSFDISARLTHSSDLISPEMEKCVLRCGPCHRAKTKACGETAGGWNRIPDDLMEHGTARMYHLRGCRCDHCRFAARLYKLHLIGMADVASLADQDEARVHRPAKGTHGTVSAYRYCGPPKCDECKAAKAEAQRRWRQHRD